MSQTLGTQTELTGAGAALDYVAVTPHDTNDIASGRLFRGFRTGAAGDVVAVKPDNTTVLIKNMQPGEYFPGLIRRINATGTTANMFIVALS